MYCARKPSFRHASFLVVDIRIALAPVAAAMDSLTGTSEELRAHYGWPKFYRKPINTAEAPIFASDKADDALRVARHFAVKMLHSVPRSRDALANAGMRFSAIATGESAKGSTRAKCGKADTILRPSCSRPGGTNNNSGVTCGEENLLHYPVGPYKRENILLHDFAHSVHLIGMAEIAPDFDARVRDTFEPAKQAGL